jgi:hypothetical protein
MWKKDVREGEGVLRYANGDMYNGQWCNDMRSGEGSLVFADGSSFVGQWREDAYDHGSLRASDGSCIPGWMLPHSISHQSRFNSHYTTHIFLYLPPCAGVFAHGKIEISSDGTSATLDETTLRQTKTSINIKTVQGCEYTGSVDSRGRPHGHGSLVFAQGDRYDGEFEGGRRSGRGVYTYANGDVYTGMWKKDVREGEGVLRYANGDVYNGQWCNDMRSGEGSLVFADGSSFVGQWREDAYDSGLISGIK